MSETPDWFWNAIDLKPESGSLEVDGIDINYLSWSEAGNPGLLLVHGHNAHAHWWDFIAPAFRDDFQTAAFDLSGMGDSDHREEYSSELYANEILAVADHLAMPEDTVVVAHSFGGMMALRAVARQPARFKGLVLVDSGVRHPDDIKDRDREPERYNRAKVYPERDIAISRFRLQPPQQCDNQYIVDHIARNSVEYIDDEGWGWKFDEEQGMRMKREGDLEADLRSVRCSIALIYGENSASFSAKSAEYMKALQPALDIYPIANAQHHVFLDQPLAFIDAVRRILDGWAE